jgi:hypothetical protein
MTKGQQAMAVAKIYPEPEKGGRGKKGSVSEEFSGTRVSYARTVMRWAPELADADRSMPGRAVQQFEQSRTVLAIPDHDAVAARIQFGN